MAEDKNINILTEKVTIEDNNQHKLHSGGSIFERRFLLYDRMKLSVKAIDFIIIFCVILLFVVFIIGAYMK